MRRSSPPPPATCLCGASDGPCLDADTCGHAVVAHADAHDAMPLPVPSDPSGFSVVAPHPFTTVAGDTVHRLTPTTLDADQDVDKVCWLLLLKDVGRKRWFASRAKRLLAAGSA